MPTTSHKDVIQVNWFSLGYEYTPFSNAANKSQLFFKSQGLINTLNKLCTLDSSDVCVTTLVGESGCGKSTCLRALNKMRTHYYTTIIEATRGLSPQNLIKAIFREHHSGTAISRLPTTEECVQLLKGLSSGSKQVRILIDRAQELPSATVSLIRKLCIIQPNGSQLQFILCTHQPKAIADIHNDDQIKTQAIQLQNLTRKETEKFVNLKLQSTPTTQKPQQAPRDYIDKLYEKTKGNLFKINEEAALALPELLHPQHATGPQEKRSALTYTAASGLCVLLIVATGTSALIMKPTSPTTQRASRPVTARSTRSQPPAPERISRLLHVLTHP